MQKQRRALEIHKRLQVNYPRAKTALENWENDIQFLLAICFSAQTTDKQVNVVTKNLFKKYLSVDDFARANLHIFENEISSLGFYHQKAKNAINCARKVKSDFNSIVPDTIEQLITLSGVGRKTANVFLNVYLKKPQGIAVDTHVRRLSNRLGLTEESKPEKIEQDLIRLYPKKYWETLTLLLISHGRIICKARKPKCSECVLRDICPSAFTFD